MVLFPQLSFWMAKTTRILTRMDFLRGTAEMLNSVDIAWVPLFYRAALVEKHTDHDFFVFFPMCSGRLTLHELLHFCLDLPSAS
jgi:hypothetical protein